MSWLGGLLGGTLGFALGGPLGAILGAIAGQSISVRAPRTLDANSKQTIFFTSLFAMLGSLAKADGRVSKAEIRFVEQLMREQLGLAQEARTLAISIFNEAKKRPATFEAYARQFGEVFSQEPEQREMLLRLLVQAAMADGEMHEHEERLLKRAAEIFNLTPLLEQLLDRISDGSDASSLDQCYVILESEPEDELSVIKKRYRRLAMKYHPDRIQSQGLPPELLSAAEEKFKEIQDAFDRIERARGD
jgi:DnaJ like chaperone protein